MNDNRTETDLVFDATQSNFEEKVILASRERPVLVDFWAPWCGPCQQLGPLLEKVVNEQHGRVLLAKVNTDEEMQLGAIFGIRSLPTVVLLKDGRPVDGFMGLQPESTLREFLQTHLGPIEPEAVEEPELEDASMQDRIRHLRQKIAEEPGNNDLKLQLLVVLAQAGDLSAADEEFAALPEDAKESDQGKKARHLVEFHRTAQQAPPVADLEKEIHAEPGRLRARYLLGTRLILQGEHAQGLQHFLEIMRQDRTFENDLGKRALLAAFAVIEDPDAVSQARRKMAAMVF